MEAHSATLPVQAPNPFVLVDHRPFAGFGVDLAYGLRSDGEHVHVSQVQSGLACACICPACETPLIARKGKIKIAHFAHAASGGGCGRAAETNAHVWAKEVLAREKRIYVPVVRGQIGKRSFDLHEGGELHFVDAHLVKALGDIVPDVILTMADGRRLLVEVLVTHECGPAKIAHLCADELPTIEVDLSRWRTSQDREAIEMALLSSAPRKWLFNRKIEIAATMLRQQIDAEAIERHRRKEEADAKEAKIRQDVERATREVLARKVTVQLEAAKAPLDETHDSQAYLSLLARQLHAVVNVRVETLGFVVPAFLWQAAIFTRYLEAPYAGKYELPEFTLEWVMQEIEDCIHPAFLAIPDGPVREGLRQHAPKALLPHEAVGRYLEALCDLDYLEQDGFELYRFSPSQADLIEQRYRKRMEVDGREERLDHFLTRILARLPPDSLIDFDMEAWRQQPIEDVDRTVEMMLEEGCSTWERLARGLQAIELMMDSGDIVDDPMGLPLDQYIIELKESRRAKAQAMADERKASLLREARLALGEEAGAWVSKPDEDGLTPKQLARLDQAELDGLVRTLHAIGRERAERLARDKEIAGLQGRLKRSAEEVLGEELAAHFLKVHDPRIGGVPLRICTSDGGLVTCLKLLASMKVGPKNKKRK